MYPRVILKGMMIKKSQQKRRISPSNYKERLFVLDTQDLKYSERRPGKQPILKGCIQLSQIKCVEMVYPDVPIPCTYKYPFQVFHDSYYLYIFAPDNECRQRWVQALKEETRYNNLVVKYHPNIWLNRRWRCCQQSEKLAPGCQAYCPTSNAIENPFPTILTSQGSEQDLGPRVVIALREYTPQEDYDLMLHKDHEYIIVDSSHCNWWLVRDPEGNTGFVPNTYVAEKFKSNLDRFEWYRKDITRAGAEELLSAMGKEGAFVVRDSRQAGVYTVSVFTKAPGSKGERIPRVKHYQIKETEMEAAPKFYLAENYRFGTIPELIQYHQHNAAGLITRLRHPISTVSGDSQDLNLLQAGQWEVDPEEIVLGEEIGSGQFGMVLEGSWRNQRVAVKMMRVESMSEDEFREEAQVMMRLSHPKLVQLYRICTQRSPTCLVFEFMENGCLSDYLQARRGSLSLQVLLNMGLDVSEGMAYLESSSFIHRDLAARNCLVSSNMEVKVSDFGMARFVLDDQYTSSLGSKFPVKWSPPEVIKFSRFSSKSDVWSFGVLLWEVYSEGRQPYEHRSNAEVVESLNVGQRLLKPRLAPAQVYILMEWCWKEKPEDRPTFSLLLHELASLADR